MSEWKRFIIYYIYYYRNGNNIDMFLLQAVSELSWTKVHDIKRTHYVVSRS